MGKLIDLTGRKFGMLTVIERRGSNSQKSALWLCECECGNKKVIDGHELRRGRVSCGCYHDKLASQRAVERNFKHGHRKERIYRIWTGIKTRCNNPNDVTYKRYGGRGIKVCDEWLNNFQAFYDWAMANGYSDDLTIDRINTNGNYEPSNCRWSTQKEQQNNKRNNRLITYNGQTKTIMQWSQEIGIKHATLLRRIDKGWSVERALNTPLKTKK